MGKNDYQTRKRVQLQDFLEVGEKMGRQQITDMFVHVLTDYSVMGNKKLRPEEVAKVVNETSERLQYFQEAWQKSPEADYKQQQLDAGMRESVPAELFSPFSERYPYLKQYDYTKGKWK